MAPAVCPNGHTSDSTDYCDVCGSPMVAAEANAGGATPAASPAAAKPLGVVCPNCGVMNAPGALFCEACGYDYTTGTMPRSPETSILDLDAPLPVPSDHQAGADQSPGAAQGFQDAESQDADPLALGASGPSSAAPTAPKATPTAPKATPTAPKATPTAPKKTPTGSSLDLDAPLPPAAAPPAAPPVPPQPRPAVDTSSTPPSVPEPVSDTFDWVLELWVDPEWYALQESPDPMPSAGLPDVFPLRKRSLLVGRPSRSRNITPDIDCEPDTGISRRQAQLTTDGTRWFIEDLDSANGTFVAEASGAMPTIPIAPGRRRELSGDERIYVGAWTRLVLRRATPEEQEAYATA